jgi:Fic family protein
MPHKIYIHENENWPTFHWDKEGLSDQLASVRHRQGRLIGRMKSLGFELRSEAELDTLTVDILKTTEIEGELLDVNQVRSSLARHLGIEISGFRPSARNIEGSGRNDDRCHSKLPKATYGRTFVRLASSPFPHRQKWNEKN